MQSKILRITFWNTFIFHFQLHQPFCVWQHHARIGGRSYIPRASRVWLLLHFPSPYCLCYQQFACTAPLHRKIFRHLAFSSYPVWKGFDWTIQQTPSPCSWGGSLEKAHNWWKIHRPCLLKEYKSCCWCWDPSQIPWGRGSAVRNTHIWHVYVCSKLQSPAKQIWGCTGWGRAQNSLPVLACNTGLQGPVIWLSTEGKFVSPTTECNEISTGL